MEICDVASGIGEDGVVRRVRLKFHRPPKRLIVLRLCAGIRLDQLLYWFLQQPDTDPLSTDLADDWPVVSAINGELPGG